MSSRSRSWMFQVVLAVAGAASGAEVGTFGVNGHIPGPEVADRIAEAGITWVRIDMIWALVEPEPDHFDWTVYDRTVRHLEERGLRIFATLQGTPGWATDGSEFSGEPREVGRWRRFCYRAAQRYRGRVDAWGIWNEPNLGRFWQGSRTAYLYDILLAGIDAIEIADPGAFVVAPDLAHLQSSDWDSWLRSVISTAGSRLDALSHHTYPSNGRASDVTRKLETGSSYPWDPPSVRSVLQGSGWWGRPFWLTETGVESARYSEAGQQSFYSGLLADWFSSSGSHWWIDRVFFYEINDDPNAGSTFGIVGPPPGLEPKPAFGTYRDFIAGAELDDAQLEGWSDGIVLPSSGRATVALTFRNTGTTSWQSATGYSAQGTIDAPGWTLTGGLLPPGRTVHPGSSVTVLFEVQAPPLAPANDPVQARLTARMWRSAVWPFGDAATPVIIQTDGRLPSGTATPATLVVAEGSAASFAVMLDEGAGVLRWYRDGALVPESPRTRGTFRDTLEIVQVEPGDAGDYHCVVRNRTGGLTLFAGRLRVIPSTPDLDVAPRTPSGRQAATLARWRAWRRGAATAPASSQDR